MGFEKGSERAERFAPVADGCLQVARFGERLPVRRIEENRIVTEAAVAFRFRGDAALDRPAGFEQHAIALREHQRADESRRALERTFRAKRLVDPRAPPKRADSTPGMPPSASMARPESSATVSSPVAAA